MVLPKLGRNDERSEPGLVLLPPGLLMPGTFGKSPKDGTFGIAPFKCGAPFENTSMYNVTNNNKMIFIFTLV